MASPVDVVNLALAHLGERPTVVSIDPPEGSAEAEYSAIFYPIARDAILEAVPWTFATRRATLAAYAVTPPSPWAYAFSLPNGIIRAHRVLMPGETDDNAGQPFVIEAVTSSNVGVLFTGVDAPDLVYTARVEDLTRWTPLAVNALSYLLASYLAGPVTKDPKVKVAMYQSYAAELSRATVANANSRKSDAYSTFVPSAIQARNA